MHNKRVEVKQGMSLLIVVIIVLASDGFAESVVVEDMESIRESVAQRIVSTPNTASLNELILVVSHAGSTWEERTALTYLRDTIFSRLGLDDPEQVRSRSEYHARLSREIVSGSDGARRSMAVCHHLIRSASSFSDWRIREASVVKASGILWASSYVQMDPGRCNDAGLLATLVRVYHSEGDWRLVARLGGIMLQVFSDEMLAAYAMEIVQTADERPCPESMLLYGRLQGPSRHDVETLLESWPEKRERESARYGLPYSRRNMQRCGDAIRARFGDTEALDRLIAEASDAELVTHGAFVSTAALLCYVESPVAIECLVDILESCLGGENMGREDMQQDCIGIAYDLQDFLRKEGWISMPMDKETYMRGRGDIVLPAAMKYLASVGGERVE